MGLSASNVFLIGATAAVGFGAGAFLVLLKAPVEPPVALTQPEPAVVAAPVEESVSEARAAEILAALERLTEAQENQQVTREAPVDLLEVAPATPRQPEPTSPAITASFFDTAKSNLEAQNTCGNDLRALADGTRVYFPSGGLSASDAGLATARLIGQIASACPGFTVQVEGHSDRSGDPQLNQQLSERRALTVVSRLAASGIDTSNFVAVGFGDTQPSGVTGPEDNAFYDRRVEFTIIENTRSASLGGTGQAAWQQPDRNVPPCVRDLEAQAAQSRIFFAPRAITVTPGEMESARALAARTQGCEGARLRLVGHFSDAPGSSETPATARLRALALMSLLVSSGIPSTDVLIGAPSRSIGVPGQQGVPNSRIDFQIIID